MKKLLYFLPILGTTLVYSCTHKTESAKLTTKLITHKIDKSIFDSLDVSNLFCVQDSLNQQSENRFDGFYGKDNHRIEMYFATVTKAPSRSNVYLVKGKSRFKKNISPFQGEIIFEKASKVKDTDNNNNVETFNSFEGRFKLKEDTLSKDYGIFEGKIFIDFYKSKKGEIGLLWRQDSETQGGGFKFEGDWTSNKTGQKKPVVWAKDLLAFADDILKDFNIGERDAYINPKYRHLGWADFWENDEWWNDTKVIQ